MRRAGEDSGADGGDFQAEVHEELHGSVGKAALDAYGGLRIHGTGFELGDEAAAAGADAFDLRHNRFPFCLTMQRYAAILTVLVK